MHKVPGVSQVAPSDGGVMAQVVVRHDGVGVAPAVVRVGGTRQAVDVAGMAPRQACLFKADHQPVGGAVSQKHDSLQSVVVEIIADVINRAFVMG